ncbi:MAG: phosphatidate cytidylyltransferase [Acidobacteriota bacterium]
MSLLPTGPFTTWPPVAQMGAVVLALLGAATVACLLLRWRRPQQDWRELTARIRSWWVMAAVFLAALGAGLTVAIVLFAALSFWSLKEYVTLLATRPADHKALFVAFLAIPVQYWLVYLGWYGMFIILVPVWMFLVLPVLLVLAADPRGFVASVSQLHWGVMAFVFGLSHIAFLLRLTPRPEASFDGRGLILFLVFVTEMSDVFQYVWGKLLGRHRILPVISPNKTWEGFVGGVLSVTALALPVRFLTPFSTAETLGVTLLVAVAGFCGGAVMSAVKRDFGVKDFGVAIPGHGGMIDRVDSLCFAAPVFFHYVRYVWS